MPQPFVLNRRAPEAFVLNGFADSLAWSKIFAKN